MKAVILAGGSGSRLWPLSRELYPKQLLKLDSDESLLQSTFSRLNSFISAKNILTVTNVMHSVDVRLQLNELSPDAVVLSEPIAKNTAPAIATSLNYLEQKYGDDIVIILPSDHLISDIEKFKKSVDEAIELANKGYIVTFGAKPMYPETGYGYIKISDSLSDFGYKVDSFVEKPNYQLAEDYCSSHQFYWNCGIFLGKISTFNSEFEKYASEIVENLSGLKYDSVNNIGYYGYAKMPSISIDYAVMEKSKNIALVELQSDWNDLGSWQSIYDIKEKDEDGNVIIGNVVSQNTKRSMVYSTSKLVAVSGIDDVILVETEDAVMLCKKELSQDVKGLYSVLKQKEDSTVSVHKTVFKPWGYYKCLSEENNLRIRLIVVSPFQEMPIHIHRAAFEYCTIIEGEAQVVSDGTSKILKVGDNIKIPPNSKHLLKNLSDETIKILETQCSKIS